MISATDPDSVETTYGYDGAGNRISVQVGTQAPELTSYTADGLPDTVVKDQTTIETYTHDGAGNLTSINDQVGSEDRSFAYDAYSRTTAFCPQETYSSSCSDHVSFGIDALSRTISRTEGAVSTEFAFRGTSEDIVAQGSTLIAQGPFGPLAQGSVGNASFYLKDLHSDIVGLYGASSGTKLYDPWGEPKTATGASTELGFQSDYTDPDSGQVDMGTRYYEPTMGRFSTQDVLFGEMANPNTLNLYVYGNSSPLSYFDPTGMAGVVCHGDRCGPPTAGGIGDLENDNGVSYNDTHKNYNGNGNTQGEGATGESNATGEIEPDIVERDIEAEEAYRAYSAYLRYPNQYSRLEARQIVDDYLTAFAGCFPREAGCSVQEFTRGPGNVLQVKYVALDEGRVILVRRSEATWVTFSYRIVNSPEPNAEYDVDGWWLKSHVLTSKRGDVSMFPSGCFPPCISDPTLRTSHLRVPEEFGRIEAVTATITTSVSVEGGSYYWAVSPERDYTIDIP